MRFGTVGAIMRSLGGTASGGSVPSFTAPTLAMANDGDGSVTATVTGNLLAGGGNQTSRLKYQAHADTTWTIHSSPITGNGTISDLTGLPTGLHFFMLVPYDSITGAEGPASDVVPLMVNDQSVSTVDQILTAIDAVIDAAGLSTEDSDASSQPVTAVVETPPIFNDVQTPVVKIFPDVVDVQATRSKLNEGVYRVNVVYCHHAPTSAIQTKDSRIVEQLVELFVGNRLTGMPTVYCLSTDAPAVLNLEELYERSNVVAARTLVFTTLRSRG